MVGYFSEYLHLKQEKWRNTLPNLTGRLLRGKGYQYQSQFCIGSCSTDCRRTGSIFVYTLFVKFGEECSNSLYIIAVDGDTVQGEKRFRKKQISVIMETWAHIKNLHMTEVLAIAAVISDSFQVSLGFNILMQKNALDL
jgi:hypothetical protein